MVREECRGKINERMVPTRMVDEITFVVIETSSARSTRIALFFPPLTIGASANNAHQRCVPALLSSESSLSSL